MFRYQDRKHKYDQVSQKLCLNLCCRKWLRQTLRRVRKVSRFGWLTLKLLLLGGLIKFKIFSLKVEYERELRLCESNLFHSTNADGIIELRKKLFLTLFLTYKALQKTTVVLLENCNADLLKYDQNSKIWVKAFKNGLSKICGFCLSRPYHFKFFKPSFHKFYLAHP